MNNKYGLVYTSKAMEAVIKKVELFAKTSYPVLITGETGTGKELIANAIAEINHKKIYTVNCAAFNLNLIESELFGHERGAFTDAKATKIGFFEVAKGQMLFLDEISELEFNCQAKLLRVLDTKEFYRVGSAKVQRTDVRIIAASNKKLAEAIEAGKFKKDLYYRLNALEINIPPLRERKEDIRVLIDFFMEGSEVTIQNKAISLLTEYTYPGNVRELKNVLLAAKMIANRNVITVTDINLDNAYFDPKTVNANCDIIIPYDVVIRNLLESALKKAEYKQIVAAKLLKITLCKFRYWIGQYHIKLKP